MSSEASEELWREERLLIGGKLVEAVDGGTFDDVDPATEQAVAEGVSERPPGPVR